MIVTRIVESRNRTWRPRAAKLRRLRLARDLTQLEQLAQVASDRGFVVVADAHCIGQLRRQSRMRVPHDAGVAGHLQQFDVVLIVAESEAVRGVDAQLVGDDGRVLQGGRKRGDGQIPGQALARTGATRRGRLSDAGCTLIQGAT